MPKRLLKHIRWTDVFTFLLFFILAAGIWYGHAMQSVRDTRLPVQIHYTGKPNRVGLGSEGLPEKVMIDIRDAGQQLNTYLQEPLSLTIDLRPYIHGSQGTIHIPSDALRRSISNILQGSSNLIKTTPEELRCTYFTELEKTVPIVHACSLHLAAEYQLVGKPKLSKQSTTIYGSQEALASVDTLYTHFVSLSHLTDTTLLRVGLDIPEGIRCAIDSVDMRVIAERYTEKKFIIPLQAVDVPKEYKIRLFPQEVTVNVRVGMRSFSKVDANDIHAICRYSEGRKDKLVVELQYNNPYITTAWAYPSVVEFLLEQ